MDLGISTRYTLSVPRILRVAHHTTQKNAAVPAVAQGLAGGVGPLVVEDAVAGAGSAGAEARRRSSVRTVQQLAKMADRAIADSGEAMMCGGRKTPIIAVGFVAAAVRTATASRCYSNPTVATGLIERTAELVE